MCPVQKSKKDWLAEMDKKDLNHLNAELIKYPSPHCSTWLDFFLQVLRDCSFLGEDETKNKSGKSKNKSGNPVLRQKVVAEKKLSVLRTALKDNPNSIPLLTKRLKVSSEILDPSTLDQEWKELLFRYPASVPLWKAYLQFMSSQFSTFSVAKMIDALADCIDRFKKIPGSSEEQIMFVIQMAANIWASSGEYCLEVALPFHSSTVTPSNINVVYTHKH